MLQIFIKDKFELAFIDVLASITNSYTYLDFPDLYTFINPQQTFCLIVHTNLTFLCYLV